MTPPSHGAGSLHCPYSKCGKTFEKPIVLTDTTRILRETYYACPHCHLKLNVIVNKEKGNLVSIEAARQPIEVAPAQCKHYFGYMKNASDDAPISDECAICPKIMQCFVKKSG